jgi:cytosine/adenosine deaminase-related metal-dependent hydrolase
MKEYMLKQKANKITNAWICQITREKVKPVFGDIIISNGKIKDIIPGDFKAYLKSNKTQSNDSYDAGGRVVTIPLVNFHEHFYSRLAKGLRIKGDMSSFYNILKNLWWKLDRSLNLPMIKASAQMAAAESIRNGVTYVFDHHSSPDNANKSLKIIAKVLKQCKMRGVLCFEATDRNGNALSNESLNENTRFLKSDVNEDIKGMFGLHASFTVSNQTLQAVSKFIYENDLGIHIHLCEDASDNVISKKNFGRLPLQRLIDNNLLNDKSVLAHSIHLTGNEYKQIEKYQSAVAVNPESNLNNSVGLMNFKLLPDNLPILCGTDGMHANPGKSLKVIFLLMRHAGFSFEEAFNRIIKIYFDQIGFVKKYFSDYPLLNKNERADFLIWDYIPPTPLNAENFWGHYIYGILERPVHSVIQGGSFLMKDKQLLAVNESELYKKIYLQGEKLFKKFN